MNWQIFPEKVAETEIAYYLTKQNRYGLPLDSRETYTKTDWIIWTATMAKDKTTFESFVDPVYSFMNETVDRIPMSDWGLYRQSETTRLPSPFGGRRIFH